MSSNVPAHKQTDSTMKPGQVVNPMPAVSETTLAQYIHRKQRQDALDAVAQEKKMTFEEWYVTIRPKTGGMPWDDWFVCMQEAWKAAQENAPSSRPGAEK